MNGAERIAAERKRQESLHDWSPEHDDEHDTFQLSKAAMAYLSAARGSMAFAEAAWPWDAEWWHPSTDPIRNLEKAGALLAAEIDRLLRKRNNDIEKKLDDMGVV